MDDIVQTSNDYYKRRKDLLEVEHLAKMKAIEKKTELHVERHNLKIQILNARLYREQYGLAPINYTPNL